MAFICVCVHMRAVALFLCVIVCLPLPYVSCVNYTMLEMLVNAVCVKLICCGMCVWVCVSMCFCCHCCCCCCYMLCVQSPKYKGVGFAVYALCLGFC